MSFLQPSRDACSDFSNLDKGSRVQQADGAAVEVPSPKKRSVVARTRSSPHVLPDDVVAVARIRKDLKKNRKMIRSSSNPDLLAVRVMEFKDESDSDEATLVSRNSSLHSSLRSGDLPPLTDRYSQASVESAAIAVEEILSRTPGESPSHQHTSFSSHFGPLSALKKAKKEAKKKKEERKGKRNRKLSNSVENMLDEKETSNGSSDNLVFTDRCTSTSPPNESPKVDRKNNKSIFRRAGRNKSKEQLISEPHNESTAPLSLVNGNGRGWHSDKSKVKLPKRPSMLRSTFASSARQPEVSSPTLINQQPELANFDLEGLVKPVDKNWSKCGYLWLRMKLPNNHYAWTHIVSHSAIHTCNNVAYNDQVMP